ncbi:MAG: transglutaminase family protein, partial [Betaproteobacteria bacterium]
MTIRVGLTHRTSYQFDRFVALSPHEIRLRPAPHCRTPILSYSLRIEPALHFLNWQQDPYGNWLARVVFPERADKLDISVDLVADMTVINPFDFFVDKSADTYPFHYTDELAKDLTPFLETEPPGALLNGWLQRFRATQRPGEVTVDMLVRLNQMLRGDIAYLVRMEPGVQPTEATLSNASGSCRDTGWLLVQIMRHLGIAARFASGYLIQLKADQKALDGPSGATADFTDLHAWAEAYLPGAGWIGLDPTSGLLAGEGHIPLACTASPGSAAPVTGFTDVANVEFNVEMRVERVAEDPRVTFPYSESQWQDVMKLGAQVDAELRAGDVRLTQGGEPTFVSVDDMEGPEWNVAALGAKKRELAENLMYKLAAKFATSPLLHFGQGKWYPGEPLPRWALGIHWRTDGKPLWRNASLFADPRKPGRSTLADAERLVQTLATTIGLDPGFVLTAFEDAPKLLQEEAALPANLDPMNIDTSKPDERARLARQLLQGIDRPAGFVLPIRAAGEVEAKGKAAVTPPAEPTLRWESSPWPLRRERLYLVPGDSPLGLRLPLNSLPWVMAADVEIEPDPDPFAERAELPDRKGVIGAATRVRPKPETVAPRAVIKTALAVQVRNG